MNGTTSHAGRRRLWSTVGDTVGGQTRHVREHVLAGAAVQLLNGEPLALKASAQHHVETCARCAARLEDLRAALAGEREAVGEIADAAFSDTRLRAQRTTILQRLARERAGARVLSFPATGAWMARRDRPAMRWLAAAAAAGLLVGLGAGQLAFTGRQLHLTPSVSGTRDWTAAGWLNRATETPHIERFSPAAEELFLSEMEMAIHKRRNAALRALDTDLAPRVTHTSHTSAPSGQNPSEPRK